MLRQERLEKIVRDNFNPSHLSVENESHKHHVPQGSETHFKLVLVDESFTGLKLLQRHKRLNQLMIAEFEQGLHALSLHLYTQAEWQTRQEAAPKSPACRDGFGQ